MKFLLSGLVLVLLGSFAQAQSVASVNGVTRVPVVLVASALGVSFEVFREAFGRVHPTGGGPTP